MADDVWEKRRRGFEEEYFKQRERELIAKARQHLVSESERADLARRLGVAEEAILNALQDLGYNRETVTLLHLVPLIHVAWIDGSVSAAERARILEVARLRGVTEGTEAHRQLLSWLEHRPPEWFFEDTLRLIRDLLQALPPEQQSKSERDLVSYSTAIAQASGGILGLGNKVSAEEKALLDRIARELEQAHASAAKRVVAGETTKAPT